MKQIKEALKIIAEVEKYRNIVDKFARKEFEKRFAKAKSYPGTSYIVYSDFDIMSENSIRVNYIYGGGGMEFNDSFIVELK